jgi:hypothetical protein
MRAGGRHLFTPREVVPPTQATISGPRYFGKSAASTPAGSEPPPSEVEKARAEKLKVEAAMQALRAVDMADGPAYAQLQDRLVAMDIVLGEHAAAKKAAVPLEVRLSRVAKERDDTAKKLSRTKELLAQAAEELRKALQTVNELHDRGRAQETKHAKLTAELRELGQRMSEEAEHQSSSSDDDIEDPDAPMSSDRGSDTGHPDGPEQSPGAAAASDGAAGHASCGCIRGRWADMSSSSAAAGSAEQGQLEDLLAMGAEALKRQVPPAAEGDPEDPKRAKSSRRPA